MQFVLDNLIATMVASTMALVLLVSRHSQIEQGVERVRHYAARQSEMNFVEVLRSDMRSAVAAEDTVMHPTDSTFSFQAVYNDPADRNNVTEQVRVRYRVRQYARIGDQRLYHVERIVMRGNLGVAPVGGLAFAATTSTSTERVLTGVTAWRIEARNRENETVGTAAAVRRYHVEFQVIGPFVGLSNRTSLKSTRALSWNATYSPPRLRDGFL